MSRRVKETCGIIAPRQEEMVGSRDDHYLAECVLPKGHGEIHQFITPEGEVFQWQYDYDCGCCDPETDERCTIFGKVAKKKRA